MWTKIFKWIDAMLTPFIEDEASRELTQVGLWAGLILLCHGLIENYALIIAWNFLFIWWCPWFTATVVVKFYEEAKDRQISDTQTPFNAAVGTYAGFVLVMIGIPYLYGGILIQVMKTKTYLACYWGVLEVWTRFFNMWHSDLKVMNAFLQSMVFDFNSLELKLFVSFGIITPILALIFFNNSQEELRKLRALEEIKQAELEREEREMTSYHERQEAHRAEAERLRLERKAHLNQIENEKKLKREAKIQEVKGKDPWDSGFV